MVIMSSTPGLFQSDNEYEGVNTDAIILTVNPNSPATALDYIFLGANAISTFSVLARDGTVSELSVARTLSHTSLVATSAPT